MSNGDLADELGISTGRERLFDLSVGQFRDPDTGEFEVGGPPPDYSLSADRFRSVETGRFKDRSVDLFDEPLEVANDDLRFEG